VITSFLRFFDQPTSPHDRRRTCRYSVTKGQIFLGWWVEGEFKTVTATLKDMSLGGASILINGPLPQTDVVWISLYQSPPAEWVEASVVEVESAAKAHLFARRCFQLRIKFYQNCTYDFFKASIEK
jgi:hypothetical protein